MEIEKLNKITSPVAIAILGSHKRIVKQLMEDTENYDLRSDVSTENGDTCIHVACKNSSDIQILESLLLKLRNELSGDKTTI